MQLLGSARFRFPLQGAPALEPNLVRKAIGAWPCLGSVCRRRKPHRLRRSQTAAVNLVKLRNTNTRRRLPTQGFNSHSVRHTYSSCLTSIHLSMALFSPFFANVRSAVE